MLQMRILKFCSFSSASYLQSITHLNNAADGDEDGADAEDEADDDVDDW